MGFIERHWNTILPLISALIGALIAGIFTLIATSQNYKKLKKNRIFEEQLKVYGEIFKRLVKLKNDIDVIHSILNNCYKDLKENKIESASLQATYVRAFDEMRKKYEDLYDIFYSSYLLDEHLFEKLSNLYNAMTEVIIVYPQDIENFKSLDNFLLLFDETMNNFSTVLEISRKSNIVKIPSPNKNIAEQFKKRQRVLDELNKPT